VKRGWTIGEPIRYIKGHASRERRDTHLLADIDERNRRAMCRRCGEVTIKVSSDRISGWMCTGQLSSEHRLLEIDEEAWTAWCTGCQGAVEILPKDSEGRFWCKNRARVSQRAYREANKESIREYVERWQHTIGRDQMLRKKYGIGVDEYTAMLEAQGGVCAICEGSPRGSGSQNGYFHVDHCHNSSAIRGLLCGPCNQALGFLDDREDLLLRAIDYLRNARQLEG
jgi:hypothetical protein